MNHVEMNKFPYLVIYLFNYLCISNTYVNKLELTNKLTCIINRECIQPTQQMDYKHKGMLQYSSTWLFYLEESQSQ